MHEAHFCSKFNKKLRTIPASADWAEEQSLKFSIQVVTKQQQVPHNSQSAFCFMLIHVQLQQR